MRPLRSAFYNGNSPLGCANCGEPWKLNGNHLKVWHGRDGRYYCAEQCEQDALLAAEIARKRAS